MYFYNMYAFTVRQWWKSLGFEVFSLRGLGRELLVFLVIVEEDHAPLCESRNALTIHCLSKGREFLRQMELKSVGDLIGIRGTCISRWSSSN